MAASNRTPAAKPDDVSQARTDGRDNSTSNDPEVRATTTTSDANITEGGRIATNKEDLSADRPGFHCGYCGQPVGPEGQHWDAQGDATDPGHVGTLVVADNWPENQDEQDKAKNADAAKQADGLTE